jgi:hypothetical protein
MGSDMRKQSTTPPSDHWLVRRDTIRRLWIGAAIGLVVLVLLDLVIKRHGDFEFDASIGFGAWFGFGACVGLIAFARLLGFFLKRPDGYYDD